MRTIIIAILLIAGQIANAQTGLLMNRYYITGSLAIGGSTRSFSDSSAWLQVGADTTNKGILFPKVLLDSVATSSRGLFVYDLQDSVLYHFDGTDRVRYMTYKDSLFIKELIANNGPDLSPYFYKTGNSFDTTAILGTLDSNDLEIKTNNVTRAIIDKNGKWLVNTTTPSVFDFYVNGALDAKGVYAEADTTGTAFGQSSSSASNYFVGNTSFGTENNTNNDKVYVEGDIRVSGDIGGSRVYFNPAYAWGSAGQYAEADGSGGHLDMHNGSGGGFSYRWFQNNVTAMTLSSSNNLLLGTETDDIYKLNVNGKIRVADDAYIEKGLVFQNNTQGIQILDGNTVGNYATIMIGKSNGSYPTSGTRHIKIGNYNTSDPTKTWHYVIGQGNDLSTAGSAAFAFGNFNHIATGETDLFVFGESNVFDFASYMTSRGQFIVGVNNSVLHQFSSVMGNNQKTTGNNQLIFGDANPNTNQGGYRDVYFGSGPVSNLSTGEGAPVTINSSGANGVDHTGGILRLAAGKGTGAAIAQDVVFSTTTSLASSDMLQNLSDRWYVKGETGYLSNNSIPTALLDIGASTGYDQFRLRTSYTPLSSVDPNGHMGDLAWDEDYVYIKTSSGWKRTPLSTF